MNSARTIVTSVARRRPRRLEPATVPVDRLLFGAPAPLTPAELAQRVDDVALPSRAPAQWPDLERIGATARLDATAWQADVVTVRRVWHSDCFVVIGGHDAVARASSSRQLEIAVAIARGAVNTPLQSLLLGMGWLRGRPLLYQPVESPDVAGWPVVRACTDRLELMQRALATAEAEGSSTYLDVASSYGWFVAKMAELGFDAWGIERDPQAQLLGRCVYGLDPSRILIGDSEKLLGDAPQYDVVSCLSLLHHFVYERGTSGAEEMIARLSRVTRRVLFVDTGEAHEKWLRKSLVGWTPEFIQQWLVNSGDFARVVPLGVDHDDNGVGAGNYGRTLFACFRD